MASGLQVVQAIHDDIKRLEEVDVVLGLLHIALYSAVSQMPGCANRWSDARHIKHWLVASFVTQHLNM